MMMMMTNEVKLREEKLTEQRATCNEWSKTKKRAPGGVEWSDDSHVHASRGETHFFSEFCFFLPSDAIVLWSKLKLSSS